MQDCGWSCLGKDRDPAWWTQDDQFSQLSNSHVLPKGGSYAPEDERVTRSFLGWRD